MSPTESDSSDTMYPYHLSLRVGRIVKTSSFEVDNINYTLQANYQRTSQNTANLKDEKVTKYDFKKDMEFEAEEGFYMMKTPVKLSIDEKVKISKFKIIIKNKGLRELYAQLEKGSQSLCFEATIETSQAGDISYVKNLLELGPGFVDYMNKQKGVAIETNVISKVNYPKGRFTLSRFQFFVIVPMVGLLLPGIILKNIPRCETLGNMLLLEYGRYGVFKPKSAEPVYPSAERFTWYDVFDYHNMSILVIIIMWIVGGAQIISKFL